MSQPDWPLPIFVSIPQRLGVISLQQSRKSIQSRASQSGPLEALTPIQTDGKRQTKGLFPGRFPEETNRERAREEVRKAVLGRRVSRIEIKSYGHATREKGSWADVEACKHGR